MAELDAVYPGYGFTSHAGYGVAKHRGAIDRLGITPEHRLSFAPLQKYRNQPPVVPEERITSMGVTTRHIGDAGETAAANELVRRGHMIIDRNWKTKYCEIDIISRYGDTLYFTEVKHRKRDDQGDGLFAITPRKQRQMEFAARMYAQIESVRDTNLQLLAIATTGDPPTVISVVEIV